MDISLLPELEKFVQDQIRIGRFASADEAINAALAELKAGEEISIADLDELRGEVNAGLREADSQQFAEFTADQIIAERHAALSARKKAS